MTKTHLIAQKAIRQYLPNIDAGIGRDDTWVDPARGIQSRRQDYHLDPLEQHVKRACDPCNRVWMGGIENDVATHVIALAKGEALRLDKQAASSLALWATIVAMLRTTQDPGTPTFDPADAAIIRSTSELPPGYVVWLLRGEERWDFPTRHQRVHLSFRGAPKEPTHLTWFWVGQSVYMVSHPLVASVLSTLNVFRDAVQILAPHGDYPIEWPFRAQIQHSAMVELTSSFFRPRSGWRGFEPREG